jgi:hypothetical protein
MEAARSYTLLRLLGDEEAKKQLQEAIGDPERRTITTSEGETYRLRVGPVPPSRKSVSRGHSSK